LNSVYNAKTTFQVVNATTAGASATHANLVASMGEYCKHVEVRQEERSDDCFQS